MDARSILSGNIVHAMLELAYPISDELVAYDLAQTLMAETLKHSLRRPQTIGLQLDEPQA